MQCKVGGGGKRERGERGGAATFGSSFVASAAAAAAKCIGPQCGFMQSIEVAIWEERLVDMNISNRMHPTKICYHCKIFYLRNHEMAMPPEPPVRCPPPPVGCTFNGESCQCLLRRVGRRRKREGGRKVE